MTAMEGILDLYAHPEDPMFPIVCVDETSKQHLQETRRPLRVMTGRPYRYDSEYKRNGVSNLFMIFAPVSGFRHVEVTDRRTAVDFAHICRDIVDVHFPEAEKILLVCDNLNTHKPASLYKAFEPDEAKRIDEKLVFHYTPKHGSWLNLALEGLLVGNPPRQTLPTEHGKLNLRHVQPTPVFRGIVKL